MEVEHGALENEFGLKQAIFHFDDQSWRIHDLVTKKSGSMLTIEKNWDTQVFSCRDRLHDTRIDGNGCFELHIGSKFLEIKLQKMGIPQNWGHSPSPQKRTHWQQRNGMLLVSINLYHFHDELKIYCKTSNKHTPWKFKAGTWSRLACNAIIKSSFVLTFPSTVSAGKGGGETEEPWHDGCGMTDGRTFLLFGMTWTESKQTVPLKLCEITTLQLTKQFVVPNPISWWPSCWLHIMFSFVLLITLNKICVLHSGSWFLSGFNLLTLGCISINVDSNPRLFWMDHSRCSENKR